MVLPVDASIVGDHGKDKEDEVVLSKRKAMHGLFTRLSCSFLCAVFLVGGWLDKSQQGKF